jgi:sirohydrochlorin cobaltochelatase
LSAKSGVVLFAHGSRDAEWAAPFRAIERRVAGAMPHLTVELAFLELMQPTLPEAVDRMVGAGCEHVTIAPLFMAQGAHLKRDLAKLVGDVAAKHPNVELVALPAAGEAACVMDAIGEWIAGSVESKS